MPGASDDVVRLFYLTHTPTVRDFQEVATLVRTIAGFKRAFTYNEPRAYVVRGTMAQIGLAEWLLKQLDHPAARAGPLVCRSLFSPTAQEQEDNLLFVRERRDGDYYA